MRHSRARVSGKPSTPCLQIGESLSLHLRIEELLRLRIKKSSSSRRRGAAAAVPSDEGATVAVAPDRRATAVPSDEGATVAVAPDRRATTIMSSDQEVATAATSNLGSTHWLRDRRPPPPHALVEPSLSRMPRWAPDARASWWGVKN